MALLGRSDHFLRVTLPMVVAVALAGCLAPPTPTVYAIDASTAYDPELTPPEDQDEVNVSPGTPARNGSLWVTLVVRQGEPSESGSGADEPSNPCRGFPDAGATIGIPEDRQEKNLCFELDHDGRVAFNVSATRDLRIRLGDPFWAERQPDIEPGCNCPTRRLQPVAMNLTGDLDVTVPFGMQVVETYE